MTLATNRSFHSRTARRSIELVATDQANTSLPPILISRKQGAQLLSISVRSVTSFIRVKALRVRRIGGRTLLSYREVLAFAQHDHKVPKSPK